MGATPRQPNNDPDRARTPISMEIFPPRQANGAERLEHLRAALAPLAPEFLSVTCGAQGSSRDRTAAVVSTLQAHAESPPIAAHVTCVGASRADIIERVRRYHASGVHRIVALRGDPPAGSDRFEAPPDGFDCAASLVEAISAVADLDISVAAYPEGHPEADSPAQEMAYLKRKVDAGASRVITQLFFNNSDFLHFRDRARAAGIDVPIIAGILPIARFAKARRFCQACGATVPAWLEAMFADLSGDAQPTLGAALAANQCHELITEGVDGFHLYTLNRAEAATAVCRLLRHLPTTAPASSRAQWRRRTA